MAIGGESRWVRVGLVASGFNIALNLVGIPAAERLFANGAIGASVITVLTEILMCAGALILIPKHLLERRTVLDVGRIVLGGTATVVVGMTLLPYALVLAIVGGALSYITVAVVLRILTTDDVRQLAGLMSRFTHRGRSESPGGFADGQL